MTLQRQSEPLVITVPRTCSRCGAEFRASGRENCCAACKKPKERSREPQSRELSPRERQVVRLVCQAKLNKEIAFELHLTEGTIKEYLNRIFRKMGVSNRTELAIRALTSGAVASEELAA
jgi:DNA-binding NarL/FixJ family response regulator